MLSPFGRQRICKAFDLITKVCHFENACGPHAPRPRRSHDHSREVRIKSPSRLCPCGLLLRVAVNSGWEIPFAQENKRRFQRPGLRESSSAAPTEFLLTLFGLATTRQMTNTMPCRRGRPPGLTANRIAKRYIIAGAVLAGHHGRRRRATARRFALLGEPGRPPH